MNDHAAPDLAGLCAELAAELDEVSSATEGEAIAWSRGTAVFARVTDAVLEVRLPADIAEAALRTPDTALDSDDRGWVRFSPADAERHVTDRTTAWFLTAWRHAADN
jgi:hypothetical protein